MVILAISKLYISNTHIVMLPEQALPAQVIQ